MQIAQCLNNSKTKERHRKLKRKRVKTLVPHQSSKSQRHLKVMLSNRSSQQALTPENLQIETPKMKQIQEQPKQSLSKKLTPKRMNETEFDGD
jgi:hypothetical protein